MVRVTEGGKVNSYFQNISRRGMDNRDRTQLFPAYRVPVPEYRATRPAPTGSAIRSEFYMSSQDPEIVLGPWTFPTTVLRDGLPPKALLSRQF